MLQYFPDFLQKSSLEIICSTIIFPECLSWLSSILKKEYGYKVDDITLSNRYQHTINSYIYDDKENPAFIHIDELLNRRSYPFAGYV